MQSCKHEDKPGFLYAFGGRAIAFDVETPNSYNNRMSAIGITIIENGRVSGTFSSLVNPQTHFDAFNVKLTGITPESVQNAPTFGNLWPRIAPLLESSILVAHNATFDLHVLADCISAYGIRTQRYVPYVCTVRMGRRCYPEMCDHKLDTMCHALRIQLDHHRAGSDSEACARLLLDYLTSGLEITPFLCTYDLYDRRTLRLFS